VFDKLLFKTYYVKETEPPKGYLLSSAVKKFRLRTGSMELTDPSYTAENEKALGIISFSKTTVDGRPITGGRFTLTGLDYAGSAVTLTASAINGTVTFFDVPLGDNYTVRETTAPSGYYRSNEELTASVTYNEDKTGVISAVSPDSMTNKKLPGRNYGDIEIFKANAMGEPLAGAEFTLYDGSGNAVSTAISGPDGRAVFANIPLGKYTVRETKAPAMYKLNKNAIEVNLDKPAAVLNYKVIDEKDGLPNVPKSGDPAPVMGWALMGVGLLFAALLLSKRKAVSKQK
jgi:uncharacterized surface anchored protein